MDLYNMLFDLCHTKSCYLHYNVLRCVVVGLVVAVI